MHVVMQVTWVAMIICILFFEMNLAMALWTGLIVGLAYTGFARAMYRTQLAAIQREVCVLLAASGLLRGAGVAAHVEHARRCASGVNLQHTSAWGQASTGLHCKTSSFCCGFAGCPQHRLRLCEAEDGSCRLDGIWCHVHLVTHLLLVLMSLTLLQCQVASWVAHRVLTRDAVQMARDRERAAHADSPAPPVVMVV